ncbi:cGMP-dependent 3',5'-cyclic phosphodiesterase isoform X2 [Ixodes scapularis]|uniref:Phosphodiesterase n=1 Tax=Ixodes ricinus TaxID=34613 RepID=A0A6B0VDN6_IXORI|nr:cGMP-dependent 3',5'-cyclic phosphodiesterase isoform X2 [Ixodes scapularis]XP_029823438.1 cGMP-dependent 3',5'-cyclic phosphodiesterase isoform X2 [Ixodes scapularis]
MGSIFGKQRWPNFKGMQSDLQSLFQLCASLYDPLSTDIQVKVVEYLQRTTQSEHAFILLVSEEQDELICKVIGDRILEEPAKFSALGNSFSYAISDKRPLSLEDIHHDHREEVSRLIGSALHSLLCVPVHHPRFTDRVVMLPCVVNKANGKEFTRRDEAALRECFQCITPCLLKSTAYEEERRLREECQSLLLVAKNLFTHLDDVTLLLQEIMADARNLTKAERCSLFLLDKDQNELVAKVFDGNLAEDGTEAMTEVRIPANQGIAGYVATSGELLNINDAYAHPLFYRKMDETTGFKTRNILCFPIKDESAVIGVAELCNKINGKHFSFFDEEIAKAFSIYCGISIMHSLMWKKVRDAQHRSKLSNELMMYHMLVSNEDVKQLLNKEVPSPLSFSADFAKFSFTPRVIPDRTTLVVVISMFEDLGFINRFKIPRDSLAKFVLMVKKGYRDPPYHNWYHAFAVAHFCYLLLKNLNLVGPYLTELEGLSLFVACLCHDLDHRGTNNSFQLTSKSILASLYSSEGSVMERHHFAQAMAILNTDGCNIFENLSRQEYTDCLDQMRDVILATDLAHHFRIVEELKTMVQEGYDVSNRKHHQLLTSMLVTCCDLSDQTKDWRSSKKIAELIYNEFFSQGDLEKAMGVKPSEMMDREKACIPELQINFIQTIVKPIFDLLAEMFPAAKETADAVDHNKLYWERVSDICRRRYANSASSLDLFEDEKLEKEVLRCLEKIEEHE